MTHWMTATLAILCFSLVSTTGCNAGPAADSALPLTLVVSGDTAGWIVPCGCTSNQSGGLLRRGEYLRRLRATNEVVYVDAGGAASGVAAYDRSKFEAILQGELAMQLSAHNLGDGEVKLGADYLREVERRLSVPFVSCNVRDRSGALVTQPFRIVEASGRRLAVVGVLSASFASSEILIDPPSESILACLNDAQGDYDAVVVLAYLPEEELMELARRLPEADIVVGGPTGQSIAPQQLGPTLVASATSKGRFLAEIQAPLDSSQRWDGKVVEIGENYSDLPAQVDNLKAFYDRLAEHDFEPSETSFVQLLPNQVPASFQVAGTAACRDCHDDDCETWDESGHAHAWRSLVTTGAHVDSYCQQCHTTGYGLRGGFVSARQSQNLTQVGCESCHGPSHAHAENPQTHTSYFGQAASQCIKCHDRENSPDFDYGEYWPEIAHGSHLKQSE